MNLRVFFVVAALFFMLFPAQADAHSLFNSAEEFIGGYRVQIATLPKFPQYMISHRLCDCRWYERCNLVPSDFHRKMSEPTRLSDILYFKDLLHEKHAYLT